MCRKSTTGLTTTLAVLSIAISLRAQTQTPDWRHIGNASIEAGMASLATGPVDRVWYSPDGAQLYARTHAGNTFVTSDFEKWAPVTNAAVPADPATVLASLPEPGAKVRQASTASKLYALGQAAYRSDDAGASWTNLTSYKGESILGPDLRDLAVSPRDPNDTSVASITGVWHSVDGGLSWTGLNQFLPNLPVNHLYTVPSGTTGIRVSLNLSGSPELEWAPGEKSAWRAIQNNDVAREQALKLALSGLLNATITAVGGSGAYLYAGSSDGRLWVSADSGGTWNVPSEAISAPIESIFVANRDPRIALAAVGAAAPNQTKAVHVLRTMNAGIFWDDMTANLPNTPAHGIAADVASGAVYVATGAGVFLSFADLGSAGRAATWTNLNGKLPQAAANDVKLDGGANQLFVAMEGYGIYATIAPHRTRDIRVVSAADFSQRAAAPGGLLSVIGGKVQSAQTANEPVPVLAASEVASQIQVPFDVKGTALTVSLNFLDAGRLDVGLPLQNVSPAVFVDPDGAPLVLDADTGVLLDSSKPARANSRIQILATGLGRVRPDWPAGIAAPLTESPQVLASVKAYLGGIPVDITQAILAPGYIGFYLVEAQIPAVVNDGPAELYLEADGQVSNRVRIYVSH